MSLELVRIPFMIPVMIPVLIPVLIAFMIAFMIPFLDGHVHRVKGRYLYHIFDGVKEIFVVLWAGI